MSKASGKLIRLTFDQIEIGARKRRVDMEYVEGVLAPSMAEKQGQLSPIDVRPHPEVEGRYKLVFGEHRIEAAKLLGWPDIEAIVRDRTDDEARLSEIDENLIRRNGNALERADFLAERKAIYEHLHPETKKGAQGGRGGKTNESGKLPFSKDAAEKAGLDPTTIQRSVAIATKLDQQARDLLQDTTHADKQASLLALIKHTPEDQVFLAKCLTRAKDPARNIAAARAEMMGQIAPQPKTQTDKLRSAWTRASAKERAEFLNWLIISKQPLPSGFDLNKAQTNSGSDQE